MDQMFSKIMSVGGDTCANVFINGKYTKVYPMVSKASTNIADTLVMFSDDVGIPSVLHSDLAAEVEGRHTQF